MIYTRLNFRPVKEEGKVYGYQNDRITQGVGLSYFRDAATATYKRNGLIYKVHPTSSRYIYGKWSNGRLLILPYFKLEGEGEVSEYISWLLNVNEMNPRDQLGSLIHLSIN